MGNEQLPVIRCEEVRRQLSNYIEEDVDGGLRARMDEHFEQCKACNAVLTGTRNVLGLVGDERAFPLPRGFSEHLQQRIARHIEAYADRLSSTESIPSGLKGQYVSPGAHIAYFWETDQEFAEAVNFLAIGLEGNDYCFVFGHDQANQKVLNVLRKRGVDVDWFTEQGRLRVIVGSSSGDGMLADIGAQFQAALASGAPLIRLLGNLGWGRQNWPKDDDILEFEAKVTEAARQFPCVIVCLYDICSLAGRIILKGGFETHPSTVRCNVLRENPHYVPTNEFLRQLSVETDYIQ